MGRHIQADGRSEIVHRCIGFGPAAPGFGLLPRLTDEAVLRQLVQILHHCGRFGCADCYCSAKPLVKLTGGDLAEFFRRLEEKDPAARDLWQKYLNYLAQLIHNIHMLYDCRVVLGGQIGQRLDGYLDTLCAKLAAMDPFIQNADYVSVCKAKVESAAVGAAISFIGEYVSSI